MVEAVELFEGARLLNPFPLTNPGSRSGMVRPWLLAGGTLVQHQPFSLEVFVSQLEDESIDGTCDPGSGKELVEQALDTWGRLDVLVDNAGIDQAARFGKFDLRDFLEILAVNFHGSLCATPAWNVMREAHDGRGLVSASSAGMHDGAGLSQVMARRPGSAWNAPTLNLLVARPEHRSTPPQESSTP